MILISFGTRPEYIKIKPLISALEGKIPFKLLFTGQHTDLLSNIDYEGIMSLKIEDGDNRLDSIVSSVMNQSHIFDGISAVLVQGDTTSVFAIALAAFHRKIKIIHLEAGLRTYDRDNPYPEEFNRQAVSRMADIHLCPTEVSAQNLKNEKVQGTIHVVGNTVLDNLVDIVPTRTGAVVVTLHRRENHEKMAEWFSEIDKLAEKYEGIYKFILPIHPNPNVMKHKDILKHVHVSRPYQYDQFVILLASSAYVITDSGGLQEETSFMRKRSIVCRKTTERPEGLKEFSVLCPEPENLIPLFDEMIKKPEPTGECPYGDGRSAERIVDILLEKL